MGNFFSLFAANVPSDFRLVVAKCISQIQEADKEVNIDSVKSCGCANYTCGCCAHIEQSYLHLNDTGKLKYWQINPNYRSTINASSWMIFFYF